MIMLWLVNLTPPKHTPPPEKNKALLNPSLISEGGYVCGGELGWPAMIMLRERVVTRPFPLLGDGFK